MALECMVETLNSSLFFLLRFLKTDTDKEQIQYPLAAFLIMHAPPVLSVLTLNGSRRLKPTVVRIKSNYNQICQKKYHVNHAVI